MLANSEFVALLKQANTDSAKMADVIGVSQAQIRYVTNTPSGMGLIKCGNVVIPFDNQISKDTDLYKLYNTNIHEQIEAKKKAEQEQVEHRIEEPEQRTQSNVAQEIPECAEYQEEIVENVIEVPEANKTHSMGTFLG